MIGVGSIYNIFSVCKFSWCAWAWESCCYYNYRSRPLSRVGDCGYFSIVDVFAVSASFSLYSSLISAISGIGYDITALLCWRTGKFYALYWPAIPLVFFIVILIFLLISTVSKVNYLACATEPYLAIDKVFGFRDSAVIPKSTLVFVASVETSPFFPFLFLFYRLAPAPPP